MAIEVRKPTANTVDVGVGMTSPAQAYDTTTGGDETTAASAYNAVDFTHRFHTWQTTSETYSALTLYCKWGTSGGFSDDTFGIEYTLDGSTWGNWLVAVGVHNDANYQQASAVLSPGQNLSLIEVRIVFDKIGGGDKDTVSISDIWTEGTYTGGVTVTPSPATCISKSIAPTVIKGSLILTPSASTTIAKSINPTVIEGGGVLVTPSASTAIAKSIAPTILNNVFLPIPETGGLYVNGMDGTISDWDSEFDDGLFKLIPQWSANKKHGQFSLKHHYEGTAGRRCYVYKNFTSQASECWARLWIYIPSSFVTSSYIQLFQIADEATALGRFSYDKNYDSGNGRWICDFGGSWEWTTTNRAQDTWHELIIKWTPSQVLYYVDGSLVETVNKDTSANDANRLYIGETFAEHSTGGYILSDSLRVSATAIEPFSFSLKAQAIAKSVNPTTVLGSTSVTPSASTCIAKSIAPTVVNNVWLPAETVTALVNDEGNPVIGGCLLKL
jgi:hypothetical protein